MATNAELARNARAGDDDQRDELLRRDPELARLYGAWMTAGNAAHDAEIARGEAEGLSWMNAFTAELSTASNPDVTALGDAYGARLAAIAEGVEVL